MAPDYSVNTKGLAFESTREFYITYILTFVCIILFVVLFKVHFAYILWNFCQLYIFTSIFVQLNHFGHIVIRLYRAACETGKFQVPVSKLQDNKFKKYRLQPLSILPPRDVYLNKNQALHTLIIQNGSLPTPAFAKQSERKETLLSSIRQDTTTDITPAEDTLVSQVTPLLGITPRKSTQLQSMTTQEDVEEIFGTRVF